MRDDDKTPDVAGVPKSLNKSFQTAATSAVHSKRRRELSVLTPSVAKTRAVSMRSGGSEQPYGFNMSNPNPQNGRFQFKGVREIGYANYEKNIDPTDVIKFGKRVNYENKLTTDQVMEEHLK